MISKLAIALLFCLMLCPAAFAAESVAPFTPVVTIVGTEAQLSWEYRHPGDYNQDGLVGIGDITPLGVYYSARTGDPNWAAARGADGNSDGLITVSDYTTIGQNYGKSLQQYVVEGYLAPAGPWTELGRVTRQANPTGGTAPLDYSFNVANAATYTEFRVWGDGHSAPPVDSRLQRFQTINHFMYQIQGLEEPGAVAALAATHYDLVVVEPTNTSTDTSDFDTAAMVAQLHASADSRGGGKLVIAYIDIGEAEDYRSYWQPDWVAPVGNNRGTPDFLIAEDPDGWTGNYPVAYWDQRWVDIIIDAPDSLLNQALDAGFDGIYLDWVEAYDDERVIAAAAIDGVNPAQEMVAFISHLRSAAHLRDPEFLVIQQNAPFLIDDAAGLLPVIDGLAQEDIWFYGDSDAEWGDPGGGDIAQDPTGDYSTAGLLQIVGRYRDAGKTVLSVDYCLQPGNAVSAYSASEAAGLVPLVTQISLAGVTGTPPPWY